MGLCPPVLGLAMGSVTPLSNTGFGEMFKASHRGNAHRKISLKGNVKVVLLLSRKKMYFTNDRAVV